MQATIGIDTGGTFTDLVAWVDGELITAKLPSTPADPAAAVLEALARWPRLDARVVHGTTVATNALLERRGARVALVTTQGFEDVIEIGRMARQSLFALAPARPAPLVERAARFGVRAPLYPGDPTKPRNSELQALARQLGNGKFDSVAIVLLYSYQDPAAERLIAAQLGATDLEISLSSEVLPAFREYERTTTTVVNAYVAPVMRHYLGALELQAPGLDWRVMASNGGCLSIDAARALPAACLLSGPAGGVAAALRLATEVGVGPFVSFDMGGTSTDVCLVEGNGVPTTAATTVGGVPVSVPAVDIHTVGAGGGSLVRLDAQGALRVGPESAGARPGPIAYGEGSLPTVTDAHVFLGRIPPATHARLLRANVDQRTVRQRLDQAFATLGGRLAVSPERAAAAALTVVEAAMARAVRVISSQRGRDPAQLTLVAFGGAGPLHAAPLAEALGMRAVLIPPAAGVFSAWGLAGATERRDYQAAILEEVAPGTPASALRARSAEFCARVRRRSAGARVVWTVDLRYRGQAHELEIPLVDDYADQFHAEHQRRFGRADRHRPLEWVQVRARVLGDPVPLPLGGATPARHAPVPGPSSLVEATTTIYVPAGWVATPHASGALVLERAAPGGALT